VLRQAQSKPGRDDFGRAVSRILSASNESRERIICLSSQYPKPVPPWRNAERATPRFPIWPCTRWGFPCPGDYSTGGELLPHLFTLAWPLRAGRFVFCGTLRQAALKQPARVYLRGVTRHRALWCSDFPPPFNDERKRSSALPKSKRSYRLVERLTRQTLFLLLLLILIVILILIPF